ncbi:hypothetical protein L6164_015009 [Bauhinia variegata]|uniref:Uncharacterized protein n=1 Tax=Bauhinia variegata TaxID=167791 RepID=A0ACB9NJW6_BAUVA|nr:hypothetical protein L6164_015009 [Bauhinia variegata]
MAITPAKQKAVELEKQIPDWLQDIYSHKKLKDRLLRSKSAKLEYYRTLSQDFVVRHSIGDVEYVKFMNDISSNVERLLLNHDEDDEDYVEDPDCKYFLEYLREDGNSYVLDIPHENVFVKYEPESDDSAPRPPTENVSFGTNVGMKPENAGACVNVVRRVEPKGVLKSAPKEPTRVADPNPTTKRVKVNLRNQNGRGVSGVNSEHHNEIEARSSGRNEHRKNGNGTDTPIAEMTEVKEEVDDDYVDTSHMKVAVENQITNVEQWWHSNMVDTKERREFREKVMAILEKPYCEEEYKRLLQDINDRKRVQNHKDLRGRLKIYEEDRLGKSFLDHHTDLAKRIASVQDDLPRVLNLLRGFFYWLKNLSHEGAFQPWRDSSCSEVLPATTAGRDHCI